MKQLSSKPASEILYTQTHTPTPLYTHCFYPTWTNPLKGENPPSLEVKLYLPPSSPHQDKVWLPLPNPNACVSCNVVYTIVIKRSTAMLLINTVSVRVATSNNVIIIHLLTFHPLYQVSIHISSFHPRDKLRSTTTSFYLS